MHSRTSLFIAGSWVEPRSSAVLGVDRARSGWGPGREPDVSGRLR